MSFSAFLAFPGQGSQHLSMLSKGGLSKIALSSEYSPALECCSDLISHDAYKLIEEGPEELINQTSITGIELPATKAVYSPKECPA